MKIDRLRSRICLLLFLVGAIGVALPQTSQQEQAVPVGRSVKYTNPLKLNDPKTGPAVSCPDPAIIKERPDWYDVWYLYCTGDPLNSNDTDASGNLKNHLISQFRSVDLINWTYIGDAFQTLPKWIGNVTTNLWAPAIKHFDGRYYLYYVAPTTASGNSAIGVATSSNPAGPWVDSGTPVIAPEANPYNASIMRAVIDPDVIADDSGQRYISYGSFDGGISIRKLSADGLTSDAASEEQIAIDNVYEGASFWKHGGYYYLFLSTSSCCDGPLSGYSVVVGRASSPMGPFFDKQGIPLLTFAPGGFISIAANGNKWVGPGGNVVFRDDAEQDYMLYHAVEREHPYFEGNAGFTRRPALLDRIEWIDEWPEVRGGYWASTSKQPAPAAQVWQGGEYEAEVKPPEELGQKIEALSDEFNSKTLSKQWHFIHPKADNTYKLTGSAYQVKTRGPDENGTPQDVAILGEPTPEGDYLVEAKVTTNIPFDNSCCYDFAQGALFIYGDDLNSIKLDVFSDFDTRQTEFGKQIGPVPQNYPGYDHMTIGPVGTTTWLRIAKRGKDKDEYYSASTSNDGIHWTRGGTWQHHLGERAQIGLAAQNIAGITVDFDYVRVYRLEDR